MRTNGSSRPRGENCAKKHQWSSVSWSNFILLEIPTGTPVAGPCPWHIWHEWIPRKCRRKAEMTPPPQRGIRSMNCPNLHSTMPCCSRERWHDSRIARPDVPTSLEPRSADLVLLRAAVLVFTVLPTPLGQSSLALWPVLNAHFTFLPCFSGENDILVPAQRIVSCLSPPEPFLRSRSLGFTGHRATIAASNRLDNRGAGTTVPHWPTDARTLRTG